MSSEAEVPCCIRFGDVEIGSSFGCGPSLVNFTILPMIRLVPLRFSDTPKPSSVATSLVVVFVISCILKSYDCLGCFDSSVWLGDSGSAGSLLPEIPYRSCDQRELAVVANNERATLGG